MLRAQEASEADRDAGGADPRRPRAERAAPPGDRDQAWRRPGRPRPAASGWARRPRCPAGRLPDRPRGVRRPRRSPLLARLGVAWGGSRYCAHVDERSASSGFWRPSCFRATGEQHSSGTGAARLASGVRASSERRPGSSNPGYGGHNSPPDLASARGHPPSAQSCATRVDVAAWATARKGSKPFVPDESMCSYQAVCPRWLDS